MKFQMSSILPIDRMKAQKDDENEPDKRKSLVGNQ